MKDQMQFIWEGEDFLWVLFASFNLVFCGTKLNLDRGGELLHFFV